MRWVYNLRVAPGWGLREPCRGECLSPSAALLGVLVLLGPRDAGAPRDAGHPSLWPPANDLHPLRGLVSASSWAFPACSTSQTGPPGAEGSAFVSPVCPSCPTGPPGTEGRAPAAGSRKGAVSCTPKQVWGGTRRGSPEALPGRMPASFWYSLQGARVTLPARRGRSQRRGRFLRSTLG